MSGLAGGPRGISAVRNLTPSSEQQAILDLGLTSVRIRAGAGTGKTTTVAMVISNLVEAHNIDPERILGITFTNKAASELADKVRTHLTDSTDDGRQVEVHTYHGFASQILSEFGTLVGVDGRVRVITPTFSRQLLSETFHHTAYDYLDITNPRAVDKIRTLADRLGDHLLDPSELAGASDPETDVGAGRIEMLETILGYNRNKRRLGVVDYADLVTLSTRLLDEHPDLVQAIRNRYKVVVLDEYQDTNPAQRVLLRKVFGDGFTVIAVGDEDQTIYEWRGASAENFEQFTDHFRDGDGEPALDYGLTQNRRSAPAILDVANKIRHVANPEAERLTTEQETPEGHVVTYWAGDALQEAEWLAREFERLHDEGEKWGDMAVLFRKNKDFAVVVDAMARHDIPVEVANLGGLLSVPEVAELRAWLTVLDRPEDSASIVQILTGSSYRLGLADFAPLTRWVSNEEFADDDREEVVAISLLEAIEHINSVDGLRTEAVEALKHFLDVYTESLIESQGMSLVEISRLILDRTHAWQNIEALPANQRLTARLNTYRLLDLAEDWSPLKGRPSLRAFLDYLDLMEDEPAEELDSAHLSGEDAVTLVTVHRAKGLEWEIVAIPAVTAGNFPSGSGQFPDPIRFPEHIPADSRIDNTLNAMPDDEKERGDFFRERNRLQEWRVAYVAATRAKRILYMTGAYWYGLPEPTKKAKDPSKLFELVAGAPGTSNAGHVDEPPRPAMLRPADRLDAPDPLFSDGWSAAVRSAMVSPTSVAQLAEELNLKDEFESEMSGIAQQLFDLASIKQDEIVDEDRTTSVTGLVTYAQCPKRYFWTSVDPLPRRRNLAAIAGTELHRRIELHQRGQIPFEEVDNDLYDVPADGQDESPATGGFQAFLESRFATNTASLVEAPFSLSLDNSYRIRGRIDAIYADGSHWEIVDFKSGRPKADPSRMVQLQAYAIAAVEVDFGPPKPDEIDVTFAYLGGGLNVDTYKADTQWRETAAADLVRITSDIEDQCFDESPGEWCRHCDFLQFCEPGQTFMAGK